MPTSGETIVSEWVQQSGPAVKLIGKRWLVDLAIRIDAGIRLAEVDWWKALLSEP